MFEKLQSKWKVGGWRLLFILVTFALGGSLCGYAGRKLMGLMGIEKGVIWVFIYIIVVTVIWPVCVILISIPFGQFAFFRNYLRKIFGRISGTKKDKEILSRGETNLRIAIFASGTGSNAEKIIKDLQTI